ncbi:hypothetical protein [Haloarcula salinisoli]|uniref:DUF5658 domain-containing protein n=1 Tax=Haloarcula salinisoli TaxID=2487746 RepID=A0A8J7Y9R3_9EURY|nr:hypothetical protein [Halomicroarcula salinisoli]MBX0286456.1 hypothetical protein [Halomicroarcula salinisoli]MBX0302055.1 hypothetical protein [Halomicroarcula salinisoli]
MTDSPVASALDGFVEMTEWLWWLALGFYGIGDLLTTSVTVFVTPLAEGNPAVDAIISSYGFGGFVALKILTLVVGYVTFRLVDTPHGVGVPLAFAVVGVGLTTWNLAVISYTMTA